MSVRLGFDLWCLLRTRWPRSVLRYVETHLLLWKQSQHNTMVQDSGVASGIPGVAHVTPGHFLLVHAHAAAVFFNLLVNMRPNTVGAVNRG